ncbi:hypothetical protein [Candidatus Palauibacter sp.]|uniref:hypothetical protein n=1 Tax=Candidatus Palauibacter sp. TaxID=3101350 RepID=UPI003B596E5D
MTGASAVGDVTESPGRHAPDGIVITRWNLALSLFISLAVLAGFYSLIWQRMNAFHATQLTLVDRVSRVEVHMTFVQNDLAVLREETAVVREEMAVLREEMQAGFTEVRNLIRAGRTDGATGAD